jgi:Flp pilus assembly protein TadD
MPTVDALYDEAIQLQQAGNLAGAIGKLEELSAARPDYPLAYSALSVFYGQSGRHPEAVEHARTVCRLEPEDPFSYIALSLACQRAGQLAEAEQAMSEAIQRQWKAVKPGD